MFFELTDLLTCPHCGPECGLVLLVQETVDRRVHSGWLGCPNCRRDFPVRGGVADLRLDPAAAPDPRPPLEEDELALKIVALGGLAEERGCLLLDERLAHSAAEIARLAPGLQVIVVRRSPPEVVRPDEANVILSDGDLPLLEYRWRAVAIAPGGDRELVAAAARRVESGGRLVLFDATAGDREEIEPAGLEIIASEGGTTVAQRALHRL